MKAKEIFRLVTLPIEVILSFGICILVFIFTPYDDIMLMSSEEFTERLAKKFEEFTEKMDKVLDIFAIIIWILIFYAIYEKI